MTGIAKIVTQLIRCKSPSPWGSCLGLNKYAEIFSDPTRQESVEPTLHHQEFLNTRVNINLFDLYLANNKSIRSTNETFNLDRFTCCFISSC